MVKGQTKRTPRRITAYNRPNRLPGFAATPRVAVHHRRVEQNTTKCQEKLYKGEAEDQLFKNHIWRKHCKWFRFHDRGYPGILLVQTLSSQKLTLAKECQVFKIWNKETRKIIFPLVTEYSTHLCLLLKTYEPKWHSNRKSASAKRDNL